MGRRRREGDTEGQQAAKMGKLEEGGRVSCWKIQRSNGPERGGEEEVAWIRKWVRRRDEIFFFWPLCAVNSLSLSFWPRPLSVLSP